MAKVTSIQGLAVGKLGSAVFSINSGQQLARAYQPKVSNPSTVPQVANRSKFKLASQLAAVVSPVLAIPKKGMVTARNQFVRATSKIIEYANNEASVNVEHLQLTKSTVALPSVTATMAEGGMTTVGIARGFDVSKINSVVYSAFIKTSTGSLLLHNSKVVNTPGVDGTFETTMQLYNGRKYVIYAYGLLMDEEKFKAQYGDYAMENASFIAKLVSSRSAYQSEIVTTITQSTSLGE